MRSRSARASAYVLAAVSTSAVAFARPPAHRPAPARARNAETHADASAYLSGKQPLVGWHAPCADAVRRDEAGRAMLTLRTLNRDESLSIRAAGDGGGFSSADLDRAAHLLRAGGGEEHPIDPRTLGLVYGIQTHFDVPEIRVVSGYRVPKPTSHSNHGRGRAIDLVVPGVPDEDVAAFVRAIGFVGVGVYPTSQFVHVDVRPRSYFWVDYSAPHTKNREHGILGDLAAQSDAAALARGRTAIEPFAIGGDLETALGSVGQSSAASAPDDEDEDED